MADLGEHTALTINGETVSLRDALKGALWRGGLGFLQGAADAALIRQAAEQRGIAVSDDELQDAADAFQDEQELYEPEALEAWLASRSLTLDDWGALLEQDMLARKLRDSLAEGKVEQYFAENILSFEHATISQIVVDDMDVAEELRAQVVEDGADLHALAREYSIDESTRPAGGYSGTVTRKALSAAMSAAVFGAQPGDVVGPVETERGWHVIKVETRHAPSLGEETRERIRELLFEEWLVEQRAKAQLVIPLLREIAGE